LFDQHLGGARRGNVHSLVLLLGGIGWALSETTDAASSVGMSEHIMHQIRSYEEMYFKRKLFLVLHLGFPSRVAICHSTASPNHERLLP
jgi:hypothetical protein